MKSASETPPRHRWTAENVERFFCHASAGFSLSDRSLLLSVAMKFAFEYMPDGQDWATGTRAERDGRSFRCWTGLDVGVDGLKAWSTVVFALCGVEGDGGGGVEDQAGAHGRSQGD